jgi:enamine deaminase RidA (YjgF/YER057c/UK114 family)
MGWFEDQVSKAAEQISAPQIAGKKTMAGQTGHVSKLTGIVNNAKSAMNRAKTASEALNSKAGELVDNIAKVESLTNDIHEANQGLVQAINEMESDIGTDESPLASPSSSAPAPSSNVSTSSLLNSATGPTAQPPQPAPPAQSPSPQAPVAQSANTMGDVTGNAEGGTGTQGAAPSPSSAPLISSTDTLPGHQTVNTGNAARDLSNAALIVGKRNT